MKRLTLVFSLVIALLAMASCSSNTPKDVATQAMTAMQKQDYQNFVKLVANKDGVALTPEEQEQLAEIFEKKLSKDNTKSIESFDFVSEDVTEDGKKATVKFTVKYAGKDKPEEEKMELVKCDDDQWRVSLGK